MASLFQSTLSTATTILSNVTAQITLSLIPASPRLDCMPPEILEDIIEYAAITEIGKAEYTIAIVDPKQTKNDKNNFITIDLMTLMACIAVSQDFSNAVDHMKEMIVNNRGLGISRITSSKPIRYFLHNGRLAPGYFSNRADVSPIDYVRATVKRMLDGVKRDVEDFVFGYKPFKNILQIQYSYEGKLELSGSIFDKEMIFITCEYATKALWTAAFWETLTVPLGE